MIIYQFRSARKGALEYWLRATNRKRYRRSDIVKRTHECTWQNSNIGDDEHVSILCSMGSFTTNITDLLTDNRFDSCTYDVHDEILFRFYTKILMIISEVLTDFQDILIEIKLAKYKSEAREMLQSPSASIKVQDLFDYVNKVCKHKVSNFHLKNHHAKYIFRDNSEFIVEEKSLTIINAKDVLKAEGRIEFIEVPKMIDVLDIIIEGYNTLDGIFNDHPIEFKNLCKKYKTTNHS